MRSGPPATPSPTCAGSRSCWSGPTSRPTGCARSARRPRCSRGRDPDELAALARSGELVRLKGVGEVTARCVAESLAGEEPGYLRRLEARRAAAAGRGRRSAARRHCAATATATPTPPTAARRCARWCETARELGHDYLVVTDHSPRLTVANGLSAERLRRPSSSRSAELNAELARTPASGCSPGSRSTSSRTARSTRTPSCSTELDVVVASRAPQAADAARRR